MLKWKNDLAEGLSLKGKDSAWAWMQQRPGRWKHSCSTLSGTSVSMAAAMQWGLASLGCDTYVVSRRCVPRAVSVLASSAVSAGTGLNLSLCYGDGATAFCSHRKWFCSHGSLGWEQDICAYSMQGEEKQISTSN